MERALQRRDGAAGRSDVTLPTGLGTGQAGNYFVFGEVYYNYTPLNLIPPATAMTLHDSIYLTPRASASRASCWSASSRARRDRNADALLAGVDAAKTSQSMACS